MATVSFVNIDQVLNHIGYSEDEAEQVLDAGFSNISWGDAALTLIGNNLALHGIHSGNLFLDEPFNPELVTMRYWEKVGEQDFINLETW
jgi:hypothetical protein